MNFSFSTPWILEMPSVLKTNSESRLWYACNVQYASILSTLILITHSNLTCHRNQSKCFLDDKQPNPTQAPFVSQISKCTLSIVAINTLSYQAWAARDA